VGTWPPQRRGRQERAGKKEKEPQKQLDRRFWGSIAAEGHPSAGNASAFKNYDAK
jgi:hypothetical protein